MKHSDVPNKINDTSIRVLELLKYMVKNDINISDTNNDIPEFENIMPETYLKYFSTMAKAGLSVRKKDKKYTLCSFPNKINLTKEDLIAFKIICSNFTECCSEKETDFFINFSQMIEKSLYDEQREIFEKIIENFKEDNLITSEIRKKSTILEDFISLGQKLKIKYKKQIIVCEPKTVEIKNGKIYFTVNDIKKGTYKSLLADLISSIEVLPTRVTSFGMNETAVFTVYDRLAENYRLRENEKIQSFDEKSKTIVAKNFDREELLKRLLKYGENCKIQTPKFLQKEFLCMLNNIRQKIRENLNEKNSVNTDR